MGAILDVVYFPRRLILGVALIGAIGVAFLFWPRATEKPARRQTENAVPLAPVSPPDRLAASSTFTPRVGTAPNSPAIPEPIAPFDPADFPIAAALNATDSTISRDLDILQQLFDAWRSNFPREGNPVGENAAITAALAGDNRLGLALIPKTHPAINDRGELCDRWGTPFRFHQLSGERMEIRSAGPDRKFATDDDSTWTPP